MLIGFLLDSPFLCTSQGARWWNFDRSSIAECDQLLQSFIRNQRNPVDAETSNRKILLFYAGSHILRTYIYISTQKKTWPQSVRFHFFRASQKLEAEVQSSMSFQSQMKSRIYEASNMFENIPFYFLSHLFTKPHNEQIWQSLEHELVENHTSFLSQSIITGGTSWCFRISDRLSVRRGRGSAMIRGWAGSLAWIENQKTMILSLSTVLSIVYHSYIIQIIYIISIIYIMFLSSEFSLISCGIMKFVPATTSATSLQFDFNQYCREISEEECEQKSMHLGWTPSQKSFPKAKWRFMFLFDDRPSTTVASYGGFRVNKNQEICKHIRLVHVAEFSLRHEKKSKTTWCRITSPNSPIHTNSLWHMDVYDISCHHMSCSNASLCWALLHRSPVCLNTRVCATVMNSSICHWRHFTNLPTEGISLLSSPKLDQVTLNLQFIEEI